MAIVIEVEKEGGNNHFTIPADIAEMTLWQFVQYERLIQTTPKWYQEGKIETPGQTAQWMYYEAHVLSIFTGCNLNEILNIPLDGQFVQEHSEEAFDNLLKVSAHIHRLIHSYQPKQRTSFNWQNITYHLPINVISAITGQETVANLTVGEYIQMNQFNHYWTMHDTTQGDFNKVLGILAVLARAESETFPLEESEIETHCAERMELFKDIPMDIGRDIWFFFANTQNNLWRTRLSKMLSDLQRKFPKGKLHWKPTENTN